MLHILLVALCMFITVSASGSTLLTVLGTAGPETVSAKQLKFDIIFNNGATVTLELVDDDSQLVYKGQLQRNGGDFEFKLSYWNNVDKYGPKWWSLSARSKSGYSYMFAQTRGHVDLAKDLELRIDEYTLVRCVNMEKDLHILPLNGKWLDGDSIKANKDATEPKDKWYFNSNLFGNRWGEDGTFSLIPKFKEKHEETIGSNLQRRLSTGMKPRTD